MKKILFIVFMVIGAGLSAQVTTISQNRYGSNVKDAINANFTTVSSQLQDSLFHSRISTASDSIDASDKGGKIYMNVAGANNITLRTNAAVPLPIETEVTIINWGAGQTTVVAEGGVTINSAEAALALRVQYSTATLIKQSTNTWLLIGDIQ